MGRAVLLTGCSGAGKSTLLAEMARRGWSVVSEPGRRVIAAAQEAGRNATPWQDMAAFLHDCDALAAEDLSTPSNVDRLFDRGRLDAQLGLARLGLEPEPDRTILDGYADTIVLAEPWRDLFEPDVDRRHDFSAAVMEYDHIASWLSRHAVPTAILPRDGVAARANWLETLLAGLERQVA